MNFYLQNFYRVTEIRTHISNTLKLLNATLNEPVEYRRETTVGKQRIDFDSCCNH